MQIIVEDYNPQWPIFFNEIKNKIWPRVSALATSIEHVGSTAVPGLAAKPIIDLDIVIPTAAQLPPVIEKLKSLGYEHRGDLGIAGREAFFAPPALFEQHLYVCLEGGQALRNHLALRDYLRAHPEAVAEYSRIKKALAVQFSELNETNESIEKYVDGKTDFIINVLAKCGLSNEDLVDIEGINKL